MKIILVRHGKPDIASVKKLTAAEFSDWIREYDAAGLCSLSNPTSELLHYADSCNVIVSSDLTRSKQSAIALNGDKVVMSDALFNEAGMPSANWHGLKLPVKLWTVFFRVAWLFGYSRNSESLKQAKARAKSAVSTLINLADEHGCVLFVGHGVFNRLLASELRALGWLAAKSPGSRYWDCAVYQDTQS